MKNKFLKLSLMLFGTAVMFTSCVKDDNYSTPNLGTCDDTSIKPKNKEISQVTASSTISQNLTDDVIEGYVTSSDIAGNFYKSITFQSTDGTIGFSVSVDATSTFINYEPGRLVRIYLKDLFKQIKDGSLVIGGFYQSPTTGAISIGRMTESTMKSVLKSTCTIKNEDDIVQTMTITQAMSDSNLNKLIELNNVEFDDNSINHNYYDAANDLGGATNWYLTDLQGNKTIIRSSSYSNFAAKQVPTGSGKIRGVMTKYGSDYQFMIRTESDVKFTNARFTTLLNEGFDTSMGNWTQQSVIGAQTWAYSSTYGNPGGMMKMSGYSGGNQNNEDWLISPVQDLSTLTNATLSFDNAYKFTGDAIKVYISNNYSGAGNPNAATWTELTGAVLSTGNYVYANSGNLNINAFTGAGNSSVYIAFKYTSNTTAASTWEIDNVKISTN